MRKNLIASAVCKTKMKLQIKLFEFSLFPLLTPFKFLLFRFPLFLSGLYLEIYD